MTDATSPFEDPQFLEMLKQSGVAHSPGMADQLMQDIAPLLAAEGFDMDNLGDDVELDAFKAAIGNAIERRNMELVTPVGDARAVTINTLREFVHAYSGGQDMIPCMDLILAELESYPTKTRPNFSHLIGVALETLDAWYTDGALRPALGQVPVEHVTHDIAAFIPTLDALALKGRAFRSLDSLLTKQPGDVVAEAGVYLIAAGVVTVAARRGQPVETILDDMLPAKEVSLDYDPQSEFDDSVQSEIDDHLFEFEEWLAAYAEEAGTDPSNIYMFEVIGNVAFSVGLEPSEPENFAALVGMVLDWSDVEDVALGLSVLHDYVHLRMERDDDVEPWEEPHELVSKTADEIFELPPEFEAAMRELGDIPEEERLEAVVATPLISGVAKLMQWMGDSKPITATGVPKRADIAAVAAMIGIAAKGVAKLQPPEDTVGDLEYYFDLTQPARPQPTRQVQSASDISELLAWWTSMQAQSLIEISSTRVRPSSGVRYLLTPEPKNLSAAEMFIEGYIREYFLAETENRPFGHVGAARTLQLLFASIARVNTSAEIHESSQTFDFDFSVAQHLRSLESMGIIELHNGEPYVPRGLRPTLLDAIMRTMRILEPMLSEEE